MTPEIIYTHNCATDKGVEDLLSPGVFRPRTRE